MTSLGYWSLWLPPVVALLLFRTYSAAKNKAPLPPGPPALPILGNLLQMPTEYPWKQFRAWTKEYGPIYRLFAGKDTIIVLGNHDTAHDLLNKRGANFSSRPYAPMAADEVCRGMHSLMKPWDDNCRQHKRLAAPLLTLPASRRYVPIQEMESLHLLADLLESNEFVPAIHRYSASIAFSLVYGFRIERLDDPTMLASHEVQKHMLTAMKQGHWAVDLVPALRHLPTWMAPFKQKAQAWYEFESEHHMRNMKRGLDSPSWNWVKVLVASKDAVDLPQIEIAYNAGVLVDAALDTTGQTLEMFIMVAHNHIDKTKLAQAEIDRVVGRERLPEYSDVSDLPYVNAFIEEVMRWRPLLAGGVPHSNLEEDTYMGYRIPKGSVVVAPHWSVHMDESIYGDPEVFRPERWLEAGNGPLPNRPFGWGRRICTGKFIAMQSLFTAIARILWAFDIEPTLDENGKGVKVDSMALADYFLLRPKPFNARFVPRDANVRKVVKKSWESAETDLGKLLDTAQVATINTDEKNEEE